MSATITELKPEETTPLFDTTNPEDYLFADQVVPPPPTEEVLETFPELSELAEEDPRDRQEASFSKKAAVTFMGLLALGGALFVEGKALDMVADAQATNSSEKLISTEQWADNEDRQRAQEIAQNEIFIDQTTSTFNGTVLVPTEKGRMALNNPIVVRDGSHVWLASYDEDDVLHSGITLWDVDTEADQQVAGQAAEEAIQLIDQQGNVIPLNKFNEHLLDKQHIGFSVPTPGSLGPEQKGDLGLVINDPESPIDGQSVGMRPVPAPTANFSPGR